MHDQIVFFGAPGTGKSEKVDSLLAGVKEEKKFRITMHPEYTYSDFVGQLLPKSVNGVNSFEFVPGPFTDALAEAFSDHGTGVYLIIEELSRGNTAAVFGDIFQLLDRKSNFESRFPIRNDNILSKIVSLPAGSSIYLPANFNIICTVNMNDQNVVPMDTAFKRRFDWEYVSINPKEDANGIIETKLNNPYIEILDTSNTVIPTTWQSFYMALDSFIVDRNNGLGKPEDKQIGQFFIKYDDTLIQDSHDPVKQAIATTTINTMIKNKLLMYLWQDVQGTDSFGSSVSLFGKNINSFGELFDNYGKKCVFSPEFLDKFLKPNANNYPY